MSYKNLLQEWCQKNKVHLPIYKTENTTGVSHTHAWKSSVLVGTKYYYSEPKTNKREAEQDSAKSAYTLLSSWTEKSIEQKEPLLQIEQSDLQTKPMQPDLYIDEQEPTVFTFRRPDAPSSNRYAFIDLENIQPNPNDLKNANANIFGFYSTYSTVDVAKYEPYVKLISIDSPVTEAADHLLTYFIGKLIGAEGLIPNENQISIVSRDKASAIIVHLLTVDGFDVTHYKNAKDFETSL